MKVDELLTFLQEHYESLKADLLSGKYKPQPVRRKEIPKPNGGVRLLGIPTVVDRLIQQGINQVINPIFDKEFSNNSYGFRPKRNAHMALKQAQAYINEGYRYVVDMDLEKFFGYSFYYGKGGIKFRVHDKSCGRLKEKLLENIQKSYIKLNHD